MSHSLDLRYPEDGLPTASYHLIQSCHGISTQCRQKPISLLAKQNMFEFRATFGPIVAEILQLTRISLYTC